MIDNILKVYYEASHSDMSVGLDWYSAAKHQCELLARRNGLKLQQTIGIVAALSPRVNWGRNIIAAENLIRGIPGEGFSTNKDKAKRILAGEAPLDVLGGNKVISFFKNISRPSRSNSVTIDRWAIRVCLGEASWSLMPNTPSDNQYFRMAAAYREAAAEVGLLPLKIQAVTWVSIKRRSGAW